MVVEKQSSPMQPSSPSGTRKKVREFGSAFAPPPANTATSGRFYPGGADGRNADHFHSAGRCRAQLYFRHSQREAALREDLHTMRDAIEQYTEDKQSAPQSLDDLVQSGYLKVLPIDPMTHRNDTWVPDQSDSLTSIDQSQPGIDDVHSGSDLTGSDGVPYSQW